MKVFMVILVCVLVTESLGQQQGKRRRIKKKISKLSEDTEEENEQATVANLANHQMDASGGSDNSDKQKAGRG